MSKTLWQILTEKPKEVQSAELSYYNPLKSKIGKFITLAEFDGINFVIDQIICYNTKIGNKEFKHTDYILRGLDNTGNTVYKRLRLIKDNSVNEFACSVQVLDQYDQFEWDKEFEDNVLLDSSGEFHIDRTPDGQNLDPPLIYWRVEDCKKAYNARKVILVDKDNNGVIEEKELEKENITYWDYNRIAKDKNDQKEYLWVEKNDKNGWFTLFKGEEINSKSIFVI